MKAIFLSSLMFVPWCLLHAQSSFSVSFPTSLDTTDTGLSIILMDDGYLISCSSVNKQNGKEYPGLLKIDWDGNMTWNKTYYWEPHAPDIGFRNPITTLENKIFMSCNSECDSSGLDIQLFSVNSIGDTLWSKCYPSSLHDINSGVITLNDSTLMIYGTKGTTQVFDEARWIKADINGNIVWDKTYGDEFGKSLPSNIQELPDGSLLMASVICNYGANCTIQRNAALTMLDKEGNKIWTKLYNESESMNWAWVLPLDDGKLALSWTKDTFNSSINTPYPPVIFFLDSMGNEEYEVKPFSTQQERSLLKIKKMSNGDILGVGSTYAFWDAETVGGWLFRMTKEGTLLWERKISDRRYLNHYGEFYDAIETPDGGILAVGSIIVDDWLGSEVWVVKLDGDGCMTSGCTADSIFITPADYVIESDETYFDITPNPSFDYFRLRLNENLLPKEMKLEIIDLSGKNLSVVNVESTNQLISTTNLNSGIYIIRLVCMGYPLSSKKIIIYR